MKTINKKVFYTIVGCTMVGILLILIIRAMGPEQSETGYTSEGDQSIIVVSSGDENESETVHIYQQYSDTMTIDTDIPAHLPESVDLLYANCIQFDEQTLVSFLMSGASPTRDEHNQLGSTFVTYRLDDGSYLFIDDGYVSYANPPRYDHLKLATENFLTEYEFASQLVMNSTYGKIYQREDLSFMSREDAVSEVRGLLSQLPITLSEEVEVYAIDHETMQEYQNNILENDPTTAVNYTLKEVLTEEDDCYLICFQSLQNHLPVTQKDYTTLAQDRYILGSRVEIFYSANGIINLYISGAYQVQRTGDRAESFISAQQAIEKVVETKKAVFSDERLAIIDCRFEYVGVPYNNMVGEVLLTPAWNITVEHTMETSGESLRTCCETVSINAITGDEIK